MTSKASKLKISKGKYTVSDLMERVRSCMDNCEFDMANRYCKRAIEMEPENAEVLEQIGVILMEFGDWDSAKELFDKCVSLSPESGFQKYMYLGQVSVAMESINYFKKGIELMIKDINTLPENSEKALKLGKKISSALCSIVEIYMTDCCDEPDAESNCEKYLIEAEKYSNTNFEIYQTMASVRLSQCREQEAKELLLKSMSLWKDVPIGDENYPEYPVRVNLAKLLIELHMLTEAISVLQNLLQEDDEIVEVSYLCGWCFYLLGEEPNENGIVDEQNKKDSWEDARLNFINVENLIKKFGLTTEEDQSILNHSMELKKKIDDTIGEIQITQETVNIDDDEWESDDDDNEMEIE